MIPPFFPRGNGPLVSILLPTRSRPEKLMRALDSLYNLAEDKHCFEFILKLDDDDKETLKIVEEAEKRFLIRKLVSPRGNGYGDLHVWVNQLIELATGDWLWLWDDDGYVQTQGWDSVILGTVPRPVYPGIHDICVLYTPEGISFPCVRGGMVDLLGHFSMDNMCDDWIRDIAKMAESRYADSSIGWADYLTRIPVRIEHDHDMGGGDKSSSYRRNGSFLDFDRKRLKLMDCKKVLNFLERAEMESVWTDEPEAVGWYIWRTQEQSLPVYVGDDGFFTVKENPGLGKVPAKWSLL